MHMRPRLTRGLIPLTLLGLLVGCGEGGHSASTPTIDHPAQAPQVETAMVAAASPAPADAAFDAFLAFKRIQPSSEAQRSQLRQQFDERRRLADAIEASGRLEAAAVAAEVAELRKEMVIGRYFEQFLQREVSDDAVRNYYVSHAEEFTSRKAHVAHILFRLSPQMDESERAVKLTAARDAQAKLKGGTPFAELAEKVSEDTLSARKGGDLGWMQQGAVAPRFSEVAFGLAPGAVSEPVETPFGYHLITLIEGPLEVRKPFAEVKGEIHHRLRQAAKQAEITRLLAQREGQE